MLHEYLMLAADPSLITDYLAAPRKGMSDGTGNNAVMELVSRAMQLFGVIAGLGFFFHAAKGGWGKGATNERSKTAGLEIVAGVVISAAFLAIPKFMGWTDSFFFGLI